MNFSNLNQVLNNMIIENNNFLLTILEVAEKRINFLENEDYLNSQKRIITSMNEEERYTYSIDLSRKIILSLHGKPFLSTEDSL